MKSSTGVPKAQHDYPLQFYSCPLIHIHELPRMSSTLNGPVFLWRFIWCSPEPKIKPKKKKSTYSRLAKAGGFHAGIEFPMTGARTLFPFENSNDCALVAKVKLLNGLREGRLFLTSNTWHGAGWIFKTPHFESERESRQLLSP